MAALACRFGDLPRREILGSGTSRCFSPAHKWAPSPMYLSSRSLYLPFPLFLRFHTTTGCTPLVTCRSRRPPAHNSPIGAHQLASSTIAVCKQPWLVSDDLEFAVSPVPAAALQLISWSLPMGFAAEVAQSGIYSDPAIALRQAYPIAHTESGILRPQVMHVIAWP